MSKAAVLKKSESSKKITVKTPPKTIPKKAAAKASPKPVLAKSAPVKPAIKAKQTSHKAKLAPVPQLKVVKAEAAPLKKPLVKKPESGKKEFKVGSYVVYPTHGVGRIVAEENQEIGGIMLRLLVISFEKDKMTLRVPVHRASGAGLRHISSEGEMEKVYVTLKARAKISRGMWSRRAQEYESKINSGCIISIAEVVRDLHQNVDQAERSYSERMIYESALGRLVGELAASDKVDHKVATDKLIKLLRAKVAA